MITETQIIEAAAPLELKRARTRIEELEAQLKVGLDASAYGAAAHRGARRVAVTLGLFVVIAAIAHRAIMWGWQ